ncbi:hypothetical protein EC951288_2771B, partial [Escherichia coli 95.1288]
SDYQKSYTILRFHD